MYRANLFPLKFEYTVAQANVQISQLHGQVITVLLAANGADVTIYIKTSENEITMATFHRTEARWTDYLLLDPSHEHPLQQGNHHGGSPSCNFPFPV
jgi:hypothetical protein